MSRTRIHKPQLFFDLDRGYHVHFRGADGKPCRHRFKVPGQENEDNRTRAKSQWCLWVIRNIPEAARLPGSVDLAEIAKASQPALEVTAPAFAGQRINMPALIQAFVESEKARGRPEDAPCIESP